MKSLMFKPANEGYPDDYVVSRIRGRRSHLISDWPAFVHDEKRVLPERYGIPEQGAAHESIQHGLAMQYMWLYVQMDNGLREDFITYFAYYELKALFTSIRLKHSGSGPEDIGKALEDSMLNDDLKKKIIYADSVLACIKAVVLAYGEYLSESLRHVENFRQFGLRHAESAITEDFLTFCAVSKKIHPTLRGYFSRVIDIRNLLSLYKRYRWDVFARLLEGGTINANYIKRASDEDLYEIIKKICRTPRPEGDMQYVLLRHVILHSRRQSYTSYPHGLILDYLLRCYTEARNLSVIVSARQAGSDETLKELLH